MRSMFLQFLMLALAQSIALADAARTVDWAVRSYVYTEREICTPAAVVLGLESPAGSLVSTHDVEFNGVEYAFIDASWSVPDVRGQLTLTADVVDCSGTRSRQATLAVSVGNREIRRQLYVMANERNGALELRFIEADAVRTADPRVSVRTVGGSLVVTNGTSKPIMPCRSHGSVQVSHEALVDGRWVYPLGGRSHMFPMEVHEISPGESIATDKLRFYIPPGDARRVQPDAIRVRMSVQPVLPNHVSLGPMPHGALGLPGCDSLMIERPATEDDEFVVNSTWKP